MRRVAVVTLFFREKMERGTTGEGSRKLEGNGEGMNEYEGEWPTVHR